MTTAQFNKLAENFADYANAKAEYTRFWPSMDKEIKTSGWFRGIGMGVNAGYIIIASCGHLEAIKYDRVKFPRTIVRQ